jgi:hypothetical protein
MFSSNFATPIVSFAAALRGTADQNKRNNLCHEEVPGTKKKQQHETDPSVRIPTVSSLPLDMFRLTTLAQQSTIEFSNVETEGAGTMDIAKLVLYIMKQNGH